MTAEQLWNDRTFFTLLTDVWKARKDAGMGPIRLKVLLDYLNSTQTKPQAVVMNHLSAPIPIGPTELPLVPIIRDEKQQEQASAGPIERMLAKIQDAGSKAQGPFSVRFSKDEGQAVQEIEAYLERLNIPYRVTADPFGNEKTFDPNSGTWILTFARR